MRALVEKEVAGIKFGVRELTLAEIRIWMKTMGEEQVDVVEAALIDGEDIGDLRVLTTLTAENLDGMAPSELRQAFAFAKEVNADFFAMRQRVADLSRQLLSGISKSPSPN